jgi:hypothetical protein
MISLMILRCIQRFGLAISPSILVVRADEVIE